MDRPIVILNVCASIDGRITFAPNATMFDPPPRPDIFCTAEEWRTFTGGVYQYHKPDMFLEGSNMLIAENARPTELPPFHGDPRALYEDYLPKEILERKGRTTWTSVIDGRGRFRIGYTGPSDDPSTYMVHLVSEAVPPEYLFFLRSRTIPYLVEGKQKVDLKRMLQKVKQKLNVATIATSSGGKLSGALIRESLLDEINILFCPTVIGGYSTPSLFSSPEIDWTTEGPSHLEMAEVRQIGGGKIWLRYRVLHED